MVDQIATYLIGITAARSLPKKLFQQKKRKKQFNKSTKIIRSVVVTMRGPLRPERKNFTRLDERDHSIRNRNLNKTQNELEKKRQNNTRVLRNSFFFHSLRFIYSFVSSVRFLPKIV